MRSPSKLGSRLGPRVARVAGLALALSLVATAASSQAPDPLAQFGIRASQGAVEGYVDDRVCGRCHPDIARSYREVAMFQSFYRPDPEKDIEEFGVPYYHPASGRTYRIDRVGDTLRFRRHQVDASGREINVFEVDVDWILGSGNHSRTYLFHNEYGELYQLPVAWYTADGVGREGHWAMAPGFESKQHLGVTRLVRRECMFCHNAYPEVPLGNDERLAGHVFPQELPEGTGCQRCHGPGAEHVAVSLADPTDLEPIRASVVNPAKLSPERRDEVCDSCHLQPAVSIFGLRRFGRGTYSYRPGERLSDYLVAIDVDELGHSKEERFEINHHPYRLRQSRCYTEAAGEMSCLTCHDPHRKVPVEERAAHYRAICQSCHAVDACGLGEMTETLRASGADPSSFPTDDPQNCVACHMPKRRPSDVVEVVMTDHTIQRHPDFAAYVAPIEPENAILVGIEILEAEGNPTGSEGEVYQAAAVQRAGGQREAVDHLAKHLPMSGIEEPHPWLTLAEGLIRLRRLEESKPILDQVIAASDSEIERGAYSKAQQLRAFAEVGLDENDAAVARLREVLRKDPERPENSFNLGRVLVGSGRPAAAIPYLERAVEIRPTFARAWLALGQARYHSRQGDAEAAFRRVLEIEPGFGRAYRGLVDTLVRQGDPQEALLWLRHGLQYGRNPQLLSEIEDNVERLASEAAAAGP